MSDSWTKKKENAIKVICIEDCISDDITPDYILRKDVHAECYINKVYYAHIYDTNTSIIETELEDIVISVNKGHIGIFKNKYFVSLAEFRENRINKILE